MKIKQYRVVRDDESVKELAISVNALIEEGWQPFGGVFCLYQGSHYNPTYFQAMIKLEDEQFRP